MLKQNVRIIIYTTFILLIPNLSFGWTSMTHMVASEIVKSKLSEAKIEEMERLYRDSEWQIQEKKDWASSFYWFRDTVNNSLFHLHRWQIYPKPYDPYGILSPEDERCICASYEKNSLVSALNDSKKVIKHYRSTPWERNFMLRIFINGVLDVHQPCRCIDFYSPTFDKGNSSGFAHVVIFQGRSYTLLELWDSLLGEAVADCERDLTKKNLQKAREIAIDLLERYPEDSFEGLKQGQFEDWANQSYQLAIEHIYQEIETHGEIPSDYVEKCRPIAERQLVMAAYRLAILLEDIIRG